MQKSQSLLSFLENITRCMRTDIISIYTPPMEGEKRGRYSPRRSPLTNDDISKHLSSEVPLGLYALPADLGKNGLTRCAVVDLDDKKKQLSWESLCQEAVKVTQALLSRGLVSWPCRSGSGHGVHLWLLWEMPVSAAQVRATIKAAVKEAAITSHVDVFPAQDRLVPSELEPNPLGNLVALPLSRASRPITHLAAGTVVEEMDRWLPMTPPVCPPTWRFEEGAAAQGSPGRGGQDKRYGPADPDTLREALTHVSNDEYEQWVRVGMALRAAELTGQLDEGVGFDLWDSWSSGHEKYNERELPQKWRSFRAADKLTIGTIWKLAEDNGWKPPRSSKKEASGDVDDQITHLNEKHFLCREGGKVYIFEEDWDSVLKRHRIERLYPGDFKLLYCNQKIVIGHSKRGIPITEDLGKTWIDSPHRRQYSRIVLKPEGTTEDEYNLWRGWTIEPSEEGSCDLFKEHVLSNICANDKKAYSYVFQWCAYTVQRPHEPIGTAIVLRGGRGTGKGTFVRVLGEIFGQHYLQIFSSKDITGRFNSHLRDCILLFADEAVWAGSKSEESVLKGLITEPYLAIEGKGRDLYQCRNMLHIIIATNNEWSVPAGMDERRFMALQVGDDKKQDEKYFAAIWNQLNNGGKARLLWELLNDDIADFNPFKVPQTKELLQQKLLSLEAWTGWWFTKLREGSLLPGYTYWSEPMPIAGLHLDYVYYCQVSGHRSPGSIEHLSNRLRSIVPPLPKTPREKLKFPIQIGSNQLQTNRKYSMWALPPLEECRAYFEKKIGGEIEWEVHDETSVKPEPPDEPVLPF